MTNRKLTVKIDAKAVRVVSGSAIFSPHSVTHMTVVKTIWIRIEDNIPKKFRNPRPSLRPTCDMSMNKANLPVEVKKSSQIISIVWQAIFYFVVWISMSLQNFIDKIPACRL